MDLKNINEETSSLNDKLQKDNIEIVTVEKKHQKKRILLVTLALIIIFIISAILVLFYGKNSKTLFLYAINQEYADFISKQDNFFNRTIEEEASNSSLKTEGNIKFSVKSDSTELKELENYRFNYTISNDYQNKDLMYQLQTYYQDKSLIDVRTYGRKNTLYLELKDLFSKYIKIDFKEYDQLFENNNVKQEDLEYLLQNIKNLSLESLSEKDFEKTREKIKLSGKDVTTIKITYEINEEHFKQTYEYILNGLIEDEKTLEIFSKYLDQDIEKIKKSLDEEKKNISSKNFLSGEDFIISIYFEQFFNNPLKYEVTWKDNKAEYYVNDSDKKFVLYDENKEQMNVTFKNNETLFSMKYDSLNIDGSLKRYDQKLKLYFQGMILDSDVKCDLTFEQKDKYNGKLNLSVKSGSDEFNVVGTYKHTIGEKITLPKDLEDNYIKEEDMTEENYEEIISNLQSNEAYLKAIESLNQIFGVEESTN